MAATPTAQQQQTQQHQPTNTHQLANTQQQHPSTVAPVPPPQPHNINQPLHYQHQNQVPPHPPIQPPPPAIVSAPPPPVPHFPPLSGLHPHLHPASLAAAIHQLPHHPVTGLPGHPILPAQPNFSHLIAGMPISQAQIQLDEQKMQIKT